MIDKLSAKAAKTLCDAVNDNEKYDLYEYAFFIILSSILHFITVIILGICFNLLAESLIFYISFIVIRKFAGGYHADTPTKCFWFSFVINSVILLTIRLLSCINIPMISTILTATSFIIIIIFSPVENDNKPLSSKEKKIYRIISIIISTIMLSITFLLQIFYLYSFANSVCLGMTVCAIVLVIEKIRKLILKTY